MFIGEIPPIYPGTRTHPRAMLLVLLAGLAALSAAGLTSDASAIERVSGPKLGRSFVVSRVSGTVLVKTPGSARASRLTRQRRTIPVGSTVNATSGKVRLVGAVSRSGGKQAGLFYSGAFKATQARRARAVIDLKLVGGNPGVCEPAQSGGARQSQVSARVIRRLRGNAKGNFRTRGNNSAATIRGTKWVTEDRCDGTRTESQEGRVETTTPIGAEDLTFPLEPGQSLLGYCQERGTPRSVCILVFSDPYNFGYYFGIGTLRPETEYTVCIRTAGVPDDCGQFPLPDDNGDGVRVSVVGCQYSGNADGVADYITLWALSGETLGPLAFNAPLVGPSTTLSCIYQSA